MACAEERLQNETPAATSTERVAGGTRCRSVFISEAPTTWPYWTEARTLIRVYGKHIDANGVVSDEDDRFYITSLSADAATPEQWNDLIRRHWAVENNCHHTFDAVLKEDDHPWITSDGNGALVLLLLRRIAYNLLTLYRVVANRDSNKHTPWREIMRGLHHALIVAQASQLAGLRRRQVILQT